MHAESRRGSALSGFERPGNDSPYCFNFFYQTRCSSLMRNLPRAPKVRQSNERSQQSGTTPTI
jgi:hypothetical protein